MFGELTPITIVTHDPHGTQDPVRVLLADVAEAISAYDRHAAILMGEACEPRRITWAEPSDTLEAPLILVGAGTCEQNASERGTMSKFAPPKGALVYGAGATCDSMPESSRTLPHDAFAELMDACARTGAHWGGGLFVRYGHLRYEQVPELPRMGMLRRPISEATDQLIAALRSSLTLPEAAQTFGYEGELAEQAARGVLEASQQLPRPLCTLIAALR